MLLVFSLSQKSAAATKFGWLEFSLDRDFLSQCLEHDGNISDLDQCFTNHDPGTTCCFLFSGGSQNPALLNLLYLLMHSYN